MSEEQAFKAGMVTAAFLIFLCFLYMYLGYRIGRQSKPLDLNEAETKIDGKEVPVGL
jgi:hypothetical protein